MKPSIQMLSPFFCGTFQPEDDDEYGTIKTSPSSTPRRSLIKRQSFCRTHNPTQKNPYSNRGLDKFEALLADLEEKKKKIYTQVDPDDISLVRFAYTSSNSCVPIVVKSKDNKNTNYLKSPPREDPMPKGGAEPMISQQRNEDEADTDHKKTSSYAWSRFSFEQWRKPSFYMPAAVMLIMVLLVFFGRSVAILCTSIGWYMIPALGGSPKNTSSGKKKKKKNKVRDSLSSSENRVVQREGSHSLEKTRPTSPQPQEHGHRRSW